ncbi:MAG: SpoIIIAH-like family protein [Oscillospiraceae bacterium]|nr:SpoIIIAH-like family protein [Oscillospiraceae bacterium]
MKAWKRNAVLLTVLVFVCAAVYLNWSAERNDAAAADEAMDQQMQEALAEQESEAAAEQEAVVVNAEYFAQARLDKQESRDAALSLLAEASAMDTDTADTAARMEEIANRTLQESNIETLIIAKGFADCVATISENGINIMVPAGETGLQSDQVAKISDIVVSETGCGLEDIVVIEIK